MNNPINDFIKSCLYGFSNWFSSIFITILNWSTNHMDIIWIALFVCIIISFIYAIIQRLRKVRI